MHTLAIWKTLALACALLVTPAFCNNGLEEVDGPNVRVMRHKDGSKSVFVRSPDNKTLTKKTVSPDGSPVLLTIYRMKTDGDPIGCKIFDGRKQELFKVSYGYHKETGQLVEERMFDSREKHLDPKTGSEMPVQRIIYLYDPQGKRSAPISISLVAGKTAKEVFGAGPSALESNPFKENVPAKMANPNARPVKPR